jgi:hypothetical protein
MREKNGGTSTSGSRIVLSRALPVARFNGSGRSKALPTVRTILYSYTPVER